MAATKKSKAKPAPAASWLTRPWRAADLFTPTITAGCVYCAGLIADVADVPTGAVAGVAGAAAATTVLAAAGHRGADGVPLTGAAKAFVTAVAATSFGWLWWTAAGDPFTQDAAVVLFGAALAATPLYPLIRRLQRRDVRKAETKIYAAALSEEERQWQLFFKRIGLAGLKVLRTEQTRAGLAVYVKAPPAVTETKIANTLPAFERAYPGLREGSVRLEKVAHPSGRGWLAGHFVIQVDTADVMSEVVWLPEEHGPLSINDTIYLGEKASDKSQFGIKLREIATMIIGLRGSGKSNLTNVLLAFLTRMVDVVIWMIDVVKSGRTAKPWNAAYERGEVPRPSIDWIATTREQALTMYQCAQALITGRAATGLGTTKITPSATGKKAIILITEEAGVLFDPQNGPKSSREGVTGRQLSAAAKEITLAGRSECVDPVFITQRATVDMTGGGTLKSQCDLRLVLGVKSVADAQRAFEGDIAAARMAAAFVHKGTIGIQYEDQEPTPIKGYFIGDDDDAAQRIHRFSVLHCGYRPALDDEDLSFIIPEGYDGWSRRKEARSAAAPAGGVAVVEAPPAPAQPEAPAGLDVDALRARYQRPSSVVRPSPRAAEQAAREAAEREAAATVPPAGEPDDVERLIERGMRDLARHIPGLADEAPEPGEADTERDRHGKQVLLDVLAAAAEAGKRGMRSGELKAELVRRKVRVDPATFHRWVNALIADGRVRRPQRGMYSFVTRDPGQAA